jgi:triosephosphate isomerase
VTRQFRILPRAAHPRRARLVVGNWKMNPGTIDDAVALARDVARIDGGDVEVGVAPAAIALARVAEAVSGSGLRVFAQDVHWEAKGAYTGQIGASMLGGLAVGSIVGHSEVRRDQKDDDARVAAKATAALRAGLRVILCLGESLEQRRAGQTDVVLERQVQSGIGPVPRDLIVPERFAIAYEPIWAIGTGVAATGSQATEAVTKIRLELLRIGVDGNALTVMYGGSVSAATVGEFARAAGVDGALVGGASLRPEEFSAIVAAFR